MLIIFYEYIFCFNSSVLIFIHKNDKLKVNNENIDENYY